MVNFTKIKDFENLIRSKIKNSRVKNNRWIGKRLENGELEKSLFRIAISSARGSNGSTVLYSFITVWLIYSFYLSSMRKLGTLLVFGLVWGQPRRLHDASEEAKSTC